VAGRGKLVKNKFSKNKKLLLSHFVFVSSLKKTESEKARVKRAQHSRRHGNQYSFAFTILYAGKTDQKHRPAWLVEKSDRAIQ